MSHCTTSVWSNHCFQTIGPYRNSPSNLISSAGLTCHVIVRPIVRYILGDLCTKLPCIASNRQVRRLAYSWQKLAKDIMANAIAHT